MANKLLLLFYVLSYLSAAISFSVTVDKPSLFRNTLLRWNINYDILSSKDKSERLNRFDDCYEAVKRSTTTTKPLESLNLFCILNNSEYEGRVGDYKRAFNRTTSDFVEALGVSQNTLQRKRGKRSLPDSYSYWENDLGFVGVKDQFGCGSCWSFPVTASIEAIYKKMTGEEVTMSEQYWVDCGRVGNGCAGGSVKEAYQMTESRQYMMYNSLWKYTAYYQKCQFDEDIIAGTNNAMKKLWFQKYNRLGSTEEDALVGLQTSPVAFDSNVSNDLLSYSGGIFEDTSCKFDPNPHSMLLVGYTADTLRVRASYGVEWGDQGYANYKRGAQAIADCNFFSKMYTITMTYRRDMEYAFCNSGKLGTYKDCKDSCTAMDTVDETGWGLAVIPTRKHNTEIYNMIQNSEYAEEKSDDKFNLFWIGLKDKNQDSNFEWADGFTQFAYMNTTSSGSKYGMFDKTTGKWVTKNSLTYKARGVCSRAINCWDISNAVAGGEVIFDKSDRSEGTIASVSCLNGGTLTGAASLTCVGGVWNSGLPSCNGGVVNCPGVTVDKADVTADSSQPVASGVVVTVTCKSGYQITGTTDSAAKLTCQDSGSFDADTPTCSVIDNEVDGTCEGGYYYTNEGCVKCGAGYWLPAGDSASDTIGCNKCDYGLTSDEGSDDAADCRYHSCSCFQVASNTQSNDGKAKMSCTCQFVQATSP